MPAHLTFAAGRDRVEDLPRRVERGLWVTRFHYVNGLADPRRALMTGMTRDGPYLIENGMLGRPVRNMRWTQPIPEAFERIDGVTAERRAVPRSYSAAGRDAGADHPGRQFQFTGQSR